MFANTAAATGNSIPCLSNKCITLAIVQDTHLAVFAQNQKRYLVQAHTIDLFMRWWLCAYKGTDIRFNSSVFNLPVQKRYDCITPVLSLSYIGFQEWFKKRVVYFLGLSWPGPRLYLWCFNSPFTYVQLTIFGQGSVVPSWIKAENLGGGGGHYICTSFCILTISLL